MKEEYKVYKDEEDTYIVNEVGEQTRPNWWEF